MECLLILLHTAEGNLHLYLLVYSNNKSELTSFLTSSDSAVIDV